MDYNHVATFVRVVRAGSFTAAAKELRLPKSSVSRNVAHLEKALGVRLLQRTTRKLILTDVGRAYFESVSGSIETLEDAETAARDRDTTPSGRVRLTIPPDTWLAALLAEFTLKHPAIQLDVVVTGRRVDLLNEGFDLAVRAGALESSDLVARRLPPVDSIVVASSEYLKARGRPRTVQELSQHDWILFRAVDGRARLTLNGPGGDSSTVEVTGRLTSDDLVFCRTAAELGAGLTLLPVPLLGASSMGGGSQKPRLEQVLPEWGQPGAQLSVVVPSSRYLPTRVAVLRDFLVDRLGRWIAEIQSRCAARHR